MYGSSAEDDSTWRKPIASGLSATSSASIKIGNTETPAGAEDEFWDWLCSELKNEDLVKCLENAVRKDYYGVMDTVKQRYRKKCRTLQ